MTAEIAILNKTAVALASDSAVTISAGSREQKIYDSADKLFDLCSATPIGVMIYNGMQFLQAPVPMLIADYRARRRKFDKLTDAAHDLLQFLSSWGLTSPESVLDDSVGAMIGAILDEMKARVQGKLEELFSGASQQPDDPAKTYRSIIDDTISLFERVMTKAPEASFIDANGQLGPPQIGDAETLAIRQHIMRVFPTEEEAVLDRLTGIGRNAILKNRLSGGQTGIVVAGFGANDLFPSLSSFEIDGIAFGRLKFIVTNTVDIDRAGDRARVLPFAQKEMVERFLYGLDEDIERSITQFCKLTVPAISEQILNHLEMSDGDREALGLRAGEAEEAFLRDLQTKRFDEIRSASRSEIDDMVEFMPKPELATMAEALVNLTSIKRRVSRGMETVGGPIDVAVISRSDGFVWVKRKHYFSAELNPRYTERVRTQASQRENDRGPSSKGRKARPANQRP